METKAVLAKMVISSSGWMIKPGMGVSPVLVTYTNHPLLATQRHQCISVVDKTQLHNVCLN